MTTRSIECHDVPSSMLSIALSTCADRSLNGCAKSFSSDDIVILEGSAQPDNIRVLGESIIQ